MRKYEVTSEKILFEIELYLGKLQLLWEDSVWLDSVLVKFVTLSHFVDVTEKK
jgi:hypothetical protein